MDRTKAVVVPGNKECSLEDSIHLSREERRKIFGIDTVEGIRWYGGEWAPGGEFVVKMAIKNTSPSVLHVRYKLPKSKFFSMRFPKPFTLSPGTHFDLDVTFRPLVAEEYTDFVEFKCETGMFRVPLTARLAKLEVEVPSSVNFGLCPTNEFVERKLKIRNVGQVDSTFAFRMAPPFTVVPTSGSVRAGAVQNFVVRFSPKEITVCVQKAACVFNGGEQVTEMTLAGTGKYPFLQISQDTVDFGDVVVGTPAASLMKTVTLTNHSEVDASFVVRQLEEDHAPFSRFTFKPNRATIPPKSSLDVSISYRSKFEGRFTCDSFVFQTPGGNAPVLYAKAHDVAPDVRIYKKSGVNRPGLGRSGDPSKEVNSVQFGDVEVGKTVTKVVIVQNNSALPCAYHFQAEDKGLFNFSQVSGVAPARLETAVKVTFRPEYAGNFVRRIYCLLENGPTQYVDFIGTAFSENGRPQPIYQRHVDRMLRRTQLGYSRYSAKEIEDLIESSPVVAAELAKPREFAPGATRSGESTNRSVVLAQDFFRRVCNPTNDVTIHEEEVHFGAGSRLDPGGIRKTVHVTNKTHDKVVCTWMVPNSDDDDDEKDFVVYPESADVAAGKTVAFTVSFRPSQDNFYYHQELEAYFYFKAQRNFRLVNEQSFTPPWCKTLRVLGHTFGAQAEQFIADIHCHCPRLEFPDCMVGDVVFATKKFTNRGSTPASFLFRPDPSNIFDVRPTGGMIPAGDSALVSFRFRPKECRQYRATIDAVFNGGSAVFTTQVAGLGCAPALSFTGEGGVAEGAIARGPGSPRRRRRRRRRPNQNRGRRSSRQLQLTNGSDDLDLGADDDDDDDADESLATSAAGLGFDDEYSPIVGEIRRHQTVFFKPTCVGISSERAAFVRNASRVPLRFQWVVPSYLEEVLDVQPRAGLLRGCEVARLSLRFSPRHEKLHRFKLECRVFQAGGDLSNPHPAPGAKVLQSLALTVVGEGSSGAIEFSPAIVDFETLLLGTKSSKALSMRNNSDCNIKYRLQVVPLDDVAGIDTDGDGIVEADEMRRYNEEKGSDGRGAAQTKRKRRQKPAQPVVKFADPEGTIPAHAKKDTIVTFRAASQGQRKYRVFWELLPDNAHSGPAPAVASVRGMRENNPLVFCDVVGNAGHPCLAVDDIRSSSGVSTRVLHNTFNLDALNAKLTSGLDEADLAYNRATGNDQDPNMLDAYRWEFPPRPVHSASATVVLKLRNAGQLLVDFELKLPTDMEIEVENWADKGEANEEENRHAAILSKGLFRVHPRQGRLEAGEEMALYVQYNYTSTDPVTLSEGGVHELPVLLKIKQGKSVRLLLTGTTLETTAALVAVDEPVLRCKVPFGHPAPDVPVVYQELTNASDVSVEYEIDEAPVEALARDNYGCPVLRCLNPSGVIEPRSRHQLRWACQPLERKTYRAETSLTYRPVGERVKLTKMVKMRIPLAVECEGLQPEQDVLAAAAASLRPAPQQAVLAPGQAVVFSHDRIDFGEVPVDTKATRVVVLRNISGRIAGPFSGLASDDGAAGTDVATACHFAWDLSHYALRDGLVKVHPTSGKLSPGGHVVVRFTLKAASCAVHLTELRCVVAPIDPETGGLDLDACHNLSLHDRDVISSADGVSVPQATFGTTGHTAAGSTTGIDGGLSMTTTRMSHTAASLGTSQMGSTLGAGSTNNKKKKKKTRQSVITSTTANHQSRMLASRMQAEAVGNSRMLTETARAEARAQARAEAGGQDAGAGFHAPESVQAMALTIQLHARVWHVQFFDATDIGEFYSSMVPAKSLREAYDARVLKTADDPRAVKKNRGFLTTVMNDLVRECVQEPVIERTLLDLQKKTRGMPIPLFTELETSSDVASSSALQRSIVAFGSDAAEKSAAEGDPWRIDVAQRVLQNTLYNLTEELLHGRFRLDQMPRVTGKKR